MRKYPLVPSRLIRGQEESATVEPRRLTSKVGCELRERRLGHADFVEPGMSGLESLVYVFDVLDPLGVEPILEGLRALLGVDRDAVLPGCAPAENAVEGGATFASELQGLDEDRVADTRREIDEGLVRGGSRDAEVF